MEEMKDDPEWQRVKATIHAGTRVQAVVTHHVSYGILLAINSIPFPAHIDILAVKDAGRVTKEDYPAIGSQIDAVVLGFREGHFKEIALSIKPSVLERTASNYAKG